MIIKGFNVTEKSVSQAQNDRYTFWVDVNANKNQIKEAVEDRFEVDVDSVNVIRQKGKQKTWQRNTGKQKERKKAIVRLKEGQKIKEFEINE